MTTPLTSAEIDNAIGNMASEDQERLRQAFPGGVCAHHVRIDLECQACGQESDDKAFVERMSQELITIDHDTLELERLFDLARAGVRARHAVAT